MTLQVLRTAFEKHGIPKDASRALAHTVIQTIESELATKGSFTLKGICTLEVVPNRLGSKNAIGGPAAGKVPVRLRLKPSRRIKEKMASAYQEAE